MVKRNATRRPSMKAPKLPGHLTSAVPGSRVDGRHGLTAQSWVETGRWVNVKSSNVASIKYNIFDNSLTVMFLSGSGYKYQQVPIRTAKNMFDASSMGRFVHQRLKNVYPFVQIAYAQKKTKAGKPTKGRRR
jgi:hypothetical protein